MHGGRGANLVSFPRARFDPGLAVVGAPGGAERRELMMPNAKAPASQIKESGDARAADKSSTRDARILEVQKATMAELRAEWRRLFGTDPPALSRDLVARAIAFRLQERAFGGLSRASRRRLEEISNRTDGAAPAPEPAPSLRSGARLVREWRGRAHTVTVTDHGFDYAGSSYRSLTQIAKAITGVHWSGPRFFGLRSRKPAQKSAPANVFANCGCNPLIDASQESAHG